MARILFRGNILISDLGAQIERVCGIWEESRLGMRNEEIGQATHHVIFGYIGYWFQVFGVVLSCRYAILDDFLAKRTGKRMNGQYFPLFAQPRAGTDAGREG